jgi:hypothetical protein
MLRRLGTIPYCLQDGVAATENTSLPVHADIYTTLAARSSRPINFARVCACRIVICPDYPLDAKCIRKPSDSRSPPLPYSKMRIDVAPLPLPLGFVIRVFLSNH